MWRAALLIALLVTPAACRRREPQPVEVDRVLVVVVPGAAPTASARGGGPLVADPLVDVREVARARCDTLRVCGAEPVGCEADVTRRLARSWNVLRCDRVDAPRYAACVSALRTQSCTPQTMAPGTIDAACTEESLCVHQR